MMNSFLKGETLAMLPTDDRIKALQRSIPRADLDEVLAQTGHDQAFCKRLPGWFMVCFVAGLGTVLHLSRESPWPGWPPSPADTDRTDHGFHGLILRVLHF